MRYKLGKQYSILLQIVVWLQIKKINKCWDIIKNGIIVFVIIFCKGKQLTKYYTHTCLTLIPKIKSPANFSGVRSISLSNVTNKIISMILANRLNLQLPNIISENQNDFITCGLITENIMFSQDIVQGISITNKGGKIVIKLDMAKAFLFSVLEKFEF